MAYMGPIPWRHLVSPILLAACAPRRHPLQPGSIDEPFVVGRHVYCTDGILILRALAAPAVRTWWNQAVLTGHPPYTLPPVEQVFAGNPEEAYRAPGWIDPEHVTFTPADTVMLPCAACEGDAVRTPMCRDCVGRGFLRVLDRPHWRIAMGEWADCPMISSRYAALLAGAKMSLQEHRDSSAKTPRFARVERRCLGIEGYIGLAYSAGDKQDGLHRVLVGKLRTSAP